MGFSPRTISNSSVATLAVSSPSPCPCTDPIKRDGQPITSANNQLMIGQKVNLSIDCTDHSSEMTDIQWTIPNTVYKNYQPGLNSAAITPLADADKKLKTISFYWSDPGTKEVSVTFKVGSATCTKSATLSALAPTVDAACAMGTIQAGTDPEGVAGIYLFGAYPPLPHEAPGFLPTAKLTMPSGFSAGTWMFTQLVKENGGLQKKITQNCLSLVTSAYCLDTTLAMGAVPPDTSPYPANGTIHGAVDSPGVPGTGLLNGKISSAFKTYIMFKPAGNDSTWVALKLATWGIALCGNAGSPWTIVSSARTPLTGNPTFENITGNKQPEWASNITSAESTDVACPSPFCG